MSLIFAANPDSGSLLHEFNAVLGCAISDPGVASRNTGIGRCAVDVNFMSAADAYCETYLDGGSYDVVCVALHFSGPIGTAGDFNQNNTVYEIKMAGVVHRELALYITGADWQWRLLNGAGAQLASIARSGPFTRREFWIVHWCKRTATDYDRIFIFEQIGAGDINKGPDQMWPPASWQRYRISTSGNGAGAAAITRLNERSQSRSGEKEAVAWRWYLTNLCVWDATTNPSGPQLYTGSLMGHATGDVVGSTDWLTAGGGVGSFTEWDEQPGNDAVDYNKSTDATQTDEQMSDLEDAAALTDHRAGVGLSDQTSPGKIRRMRALVNRARGMHEAGLANARMRLKLPGEAAVDGAWCAPGVAWSSLNYDVYEQTVHGAPRNWDLPTWNALTAGVVARLTGEGLERRVTALYPGVVVEAADPGYPCVM